MGTSKELRENVRSRLARHKERRIGVTKKKVLMLLLGGLSLSLSGSPRTSWKIIGEMVTEWKRLGKQPSERAINSLYISKLVATRENADGTFTLILSENGKKSALTYDTQRMKIARPAEWDGHWRMLSFDIPEVKRDARNAFREHLLRLGFYEQHQSFFVYPFECQKEVDYLIELHDLRKYVRSILAKHIDNERDLKKFFSLEA